MSTQEIENLKELLKYTRTLAAESDNKLRVARRFIHSLLHPEEYGHAVTEEVRGKALEIIRHIS